LVPVHLLGMYGERVARGFWAGSKSEGIKIEKIEKIEKTEKTEQKYHKVGIRNVEMKVCCVIKGVTS